MTDTNHIRCLDGVRAIAFLLVFFSHSKYEAIPGGFGVTVFFFLSGYLITSLLRKEFSATGRFSLKNFYRRRAYRILPPLYCVLAVTALLEVAGVTPRQIDLAGILSVVFYCFNYLVLFFGDNTVRTAPGLGVLWSLMVEEHFYLLFPLAYLAMLRAKLPVRVQGRLLLAACAVALLWRCVLVFAFHADLFSVNRWTYIATDSRFDSILFGCVLAIVANPWCGDSPVQLERHKRSLAATAAALLLATFAIREPHLRETIRYTLQGVALIPVFYYLLATPGAWAVRALEMQPLQWLGRISYTMYLVHFFALILVWNWMPGRRAIAALAALALSALFSEAIRRFVENPCRRIAHRKAALPTVSA